MSATVIVVHYNEIALKGGNRAWFEARLRDDIASRVAGIPRATVRRERGRIVVAFEDAPEAAVAASLDRLKRTPGIAWFSAAQAVPREIELIESECVKRGRESAGTFKVDTRRADKTFPFTSMQVNQRVGGAVVAATGRKVVLGDPETVIGVEIDEKRAFVFHERIEGPGGLPVGTSGRVVALLSGGIDSPVAAWRMMRRGCRVLGVHFLNASIGGEGIREKLDLLGEALARWQGKFTLRIVPFEKLQRAIVADVPADHRMIVYRRTMLRIADRIREKEGGKALVTGDSVGQVASQTLDKIACVYGAVRGPVLAPLCAAEKEEIIARARLIGTYEPSILPHQDCCSFLIAEHPVTKAVLHEVEAMEKAVAWGGLLEEAMAGIEIREYRGL